MAKLSKKAQKILQASNERSIKRKIQAKIEKAKLKLVPNEKFNKEAERILRQENLFKSEKKMFYFGENIIEDDNQTDSNENNEEKEENSEKSNENLNSIDEDNSEKEKTTKELIDEHTIKSQLNRLASLLHSHDPYTSSIKPNILKNKSLIEFKKKIQQMPYQCLKRDCAWLTPQEQSVKLDSNYNNFDFLTLSDEIEAFATYVSLTPDERNARLNSFETIKESILCKVPEAYVDTFGSFSAGLSTFLSDVDIRITLGEFDSTEEEKVEVKQEKTLEVIEESESDDEDEEEDDTLVWNEDTVPDSLKGTEEKIEPKKRKLESESEDEYQIDSEDDEDDEDGGGEEEEIDEDISIFFNDHEPPSKKSNTNIIQFKSPEEKLKEKLKSQNQIALLRKVYNFLRKISIIKSIEFRSRAKVPIIFCLTSPSELEFDISLGVKAKDTSEILKKMIYISGYSVLFSLSSVLKVFLYQLKLDVPFIGGLGSFKLYLLIVNFLLKYKYYQKRKSIIESYISKKKILLKYNYDQNLDEEIRKEEELNNINEDDNPNLGLILVNFLKYYGNPKNLNEKTIISFDHIECKFSDGVGLVEQIQYAFSAGYHHISETGKSRMNLERDVLKYYEEMKSRKNEKNSLIILPNKGQNSLKSNELPQPPKLPNHSISISYLGSIISAKDLLKERITSTDACQNDALFRSNEDRDKTANSILQILNKAISSTYFGPEITLDLIKKYDQALYVRLRSFVSSNHATAIIKSAFMIRSTDIPSFKNNNNNNYNNNDYNYNQNNFYNNNYNNFNNNYQTPRTFHYTAHGIMGNQILNNTNLNNQFHRLSQPTNPTVQSNQNYYYNKKQQFGNKNKMKIPSHSSRLPRKENNKKIKQKQRQFK